VRINRYAWLGGHEAILRFGLAGNLVSPAMLTDLPDAEPYAMRFVR
jgi:hypothetical protein